MKKFILCFILFLSIRSFAQISYDQSVAQWACSGTGASVTCQTTTSTAVGATHLLAVWTFWQSSYPYTATVNDNASTPNTFYSAAAPTAQLVSSPPITAQLFYAKDISASSIGDQVTVTYSCPTTNPACTSSTISSAGVVVVEYSGADRYNPLDSVSAGYSDSISGAGTLLNSGYAASAFANVFLVGAAFSDNVTGTASAGTGFTSRQNTNAVITPPVCGIVEDSTPTTFGAPTLQNATAGCSASGNWMIQMAAFRTASWSIGGGWSPTRPPQVINAAQYPGSDPCVQAQNAEAESTGANVTLPIIGGGEIAQTTCSVDPLSGFTSGHSGVLKITNVGNGANAVLALDGPIHQTGTSLIAEPQRASDTEGVMLAASSHFGGIAANRIFTSGISINRDTGATTCGSGSTQCPCYIVSYTDPTFAYVIRGTEPAIQFSGFTATGLSSLNNLPRRAIAGNGNDTGASFYWGDSFCVDTGKSYAQGPTEGSGTATFKIYAPDIPTTFSGCSAGSCGSNPKITAWTYMVYQGHAPTDSINNGTCSFGSGDQYCALTLEGQPGPGTNITQGANLKNIGLTANAYPGVAGVACIFCEEGSAWDNDASVVVRVPGPAYAVWSGGAQTTTNFTSGGASSQNFTGARRIEDYCNESTWPGNNGSYTCLSAANYARVAFILNDNWGRLGLTDVTTNTCSSGTGGPCSAGIPNPNPAVMIDGISAPVSKNAASGAEGPMRIGPIHAQSWPSLFLIGSQEPTKDVEIDGQNVNSTGANYAVHVSCNFNGGNNCPATGIATPTGPGNRTSDITVMHTNSQNGGANTANIWDEFENPPSFTGCPDVGCWTDKAIAFWAMTNCISGDGSCTGPGISVITTSNQFQSRFMGGLNVGTGTTSAPSLNFAVNGGNTGWFGSSATGETFSASGVATVTLSPSGLRAASGTDIGFSSTTNSTGVFGGGFGVLPGSNSSVITVDTSPGGTAGGILYGSGNEQTRALDIPNTTNTLATTGMTWTLPATTSATTYRFSCDVVWNSSSTNSGLQLGVGTSTTSASTTLNATGYVTYSTSTSTPSNPTIQYLSSTNVTGSQSVVISSPVNSPTSPYTARLFGNVLGVPTGTGTVLTIYFATTTPLTATVTLKAGTTCNLN